MDNFISWFFEFMDQLFGGIWAMIKGFFLGLFQTVNVAGYWSVFKKHAASFGVLQWILAIVVVLLIIALFAAIVYMIVLLIKKWVRYRKTLIGNEDLLRELSDLHRDVARLTAEKEKIMELKLANGTLTLDAVNEIVDSVRKEYNDAEAEDAALREQQLALSNAEKEEEKEEETAVAAGAGHRFFRLSAVDEKYVFYEQPLYRHGFDLRMLCADFRNFACSEMGLFYESKTIRLMFAGLASTKMILLQGISGTGKTSLPYAMGKFFLNDATIASVQPSWRDRTELFGYFNEFTKRFNETDVLKRIYEASYNDDINIIVLDEMNIARVEYYFAEMLSVLEMPNPKEWNISLVPAAWPDDPRHLEDGKLLIPQNVWYVGTANNDDSTFSVSDKVYDRAFTINLDSKGVPFDAPPTPASRISYSEVDALYRKAIDEHPVSRDILDKITQLDDYVIAHFRVAFGNRIMKQLGIFVPVYVACGGTETEGVDYMLATKVIRKFEGLNLSLIRDEINPLIEYLDRLFGRDAMTECIAYLKRIRKMY